MDDREAVAAIVAGDPAGLADAYDRYATSLYGYCRTMLPPDDAADAVQDTFVIAAARVSVLRDPRKLRPWLYAVARNECLRRLRSREAPSEIPDVADDSAPEPHLTAQQRELRGLVQDAVAGLNPPDRELIELSLRHELDGAELATVLGVSRGHAHAMASRARGQLERSLGALLVARTGQRSCAELSSMLAGWNGELTVLLRKRLARHLESCDVCGECKRRALAPAMLYVLAPLPLLPSGHRQHTLRLCSDGSAEAMDFKRYVVRQASAFGPSGFPRPQRRGGGRRAGSGADRGRVGSRRGDRDHRDDRPARQRPGADAGTVERHKHAQQHVRPRARGDVVRAVADTAGVDTRSGTRGCAARQFRFPAPVEVR